MMNAEARRDAILSRARSGARLEVEDLALTLGASRETIRRDLARLDRAGLLRRVHGGAQAVQEGPFHQRMHEAVTAKRAIARHLAAGLRPGDSLFLDTGSTTLYLAEELSRCKGLIVITNSADIAALCHRGEGNRVILLGGEFRAEGRETLGPLVVAQIGQLRAARAVLTVASVTERGIHDIDPAEAEVARAMILRADRVTVLADGSKMGRAGVFELAPLSAVHDIVTDHMPDPLRRAAEVVGTRVDIVNP
ncbi:DeoR/GlpR family DNA-binding transcription regulator [Rhodobacter sp. KR11]|uniref:DeoR/GlpR family DNA-binding transcription regulator n=1 Tax=Rhodobacter sp. KR11 TaxID=2974588 RepID=UPI0022226F79|nr:DeoR/GlpR family DNA-binding transcription regulator [Rhodobacter sp. KR11]MCW1918144.1 DeoR/GlpR family DNA-binding transcription regulator [Rhodobacter sp. KR11]